MNLSTKNRVLFLAENWHLKVEAVQLVYINLYFVSHNLSNQLGTSTNVNQFPLGAYMSAFIITGGRLD